MTFGILDGIPAAVVVDWPTTEDWTRIDVGCVIIVIVSVPVGTIEFGIERVVVGVLTMSGTIAADVLTGVVEGVGTRETRPLLETGDVVSVPVGVVVGAVVVAAAGPDVGETETVGVVDVSVPGVVLTPDPVRVGAAEETMSVGERETPVETPVIPETGKLALGLATGIMLTGLPVGAAERAVDKSVMATGKDAPVETAGSTPVPAPVKPELSAVVAAAGKETRVGAADGSTDMIVPNPTMMPVAELDGVGVAAAGLDDGCKIVSGSSPVDPPTSGTMAGASELLATGD
jgi:hypothetical protein